MDGFSGNLDTGWVLIMKRPEDDERQINRWKIIVSSFRGD